MVAKRDVQQVDMDFGHVLALVARLDSGRALVVILVHDCLKVHPLKVIKSTFHNRDLVEEVYVA